MAATLPPTLQLPPRLGSTDIPEAMLLQAAATLGCEVAAIKAVCAVEAPRGAFDEQDRPALLYERHLFHRATAGRFDFTHPALSSAVSGGYGKYSEQYGKLAAAYALSPDAALGATSWGAFQILGSNYQQAGFASTWEFCMAMCISAPSQLEAFVRFIRSDTRLRSAIVARQWADFARRYNGPDYRKNQYDTKLEAAYQRSLAQ